MLPYIAAALLEGCSETAIVQHLSDLPRDGVKYPVPFIIKKLARLDPPPPRSGPAIADLRPAEADLRAANSDFKTAKEALRQARKAR